MALRISALQLLSDLGITTPEDIDVEAIAQYCGATIIYEPLEGCEACILGVKDEAIITVNRNSPRPRQRFSGGHELGHWMRDRDSAVFRCTERAFGAEWSEDNPERRANRFAADLLLPPSMFGPLARNKPMTFTTAEELAGIFQTSLTATAIRLVEHGPFPAMIVCIDARRRKWFIRGEAVPDSLWPHDFPGKDTAAIELLKDKGARPLGPIDVNAAEWISHPQAARYVLREDSIRIPPDLVLTLLWWNDETQLLDLGGDEDEEDD